MEQTFKMAWGKGTYYNLIILFFIMSFFICFTLMMDEFWISVGLLVLCLIIAGCQYAAIKINCYIIRENKIIVKKFTWKERIYPIDKIFKIEYIDIGTQWSDYPPNSRYQLAVYFDRIYLKSIMPRRFGPENRKAFINYLLEINPHIIVGKEEKKIKETAYPFA